MGPHWNNNMKVKWKKNDKLKPQVLIDKLKEITMVDADGKVSYSAFEKQEIDSVILTMLQFDSDFSYSTTKRLYLEAQTICAKAQAFTKEAFMTELNAAVVRYGKKREEAYTMVTSISLSGGFPTKSIAFGNTIIRSYPKGLPKKYSSRSQHTWTNELEALPASYCPVTISLKSKDKMDAFHSAIYELDYARAVHGLYVNPVAQFNFGIQNSGPLNKIMLGGLHSLHLHTGALADRNLYWYERNYKIKKAAVVKNPAALAKIARTIMSKVALHQNGSTIKAAFVRYVRAFDEHDKNVVIQKLWAALESMVSPFENNAESIVRRCSFMFAERDYYAQILEHLREYRNRNVHTGHEVEDLDYHCFQLQVFFKEAISFYVGNYKVFPTLAIANKFLDLPSGLEELKHLQMCVDKALRYQRHYEETP